ncbi:MAG: arginine--tRNA ligase [Gammaproteobacteria bacterium]
MKDLIVSLLEQALDTLRADDLTELAQPKAIAVERTRDPRHGDFASNVAMALARSAGMPPRALAERLIAALPANASIGDVQIAGPGFINFTLAEGQAQSLVPTILDAGDAYGRSTVGNGTRVLVEFVSANPTGPLHVGHGRHAAFGECVAALLKATGYEVHKEYYVNDAGRQMDILAASVWLRYLQAMGEELPFPANGYRGDYIRDIAKALRDAHGDQLLKPASSVLAHLPPDEPDGGDKDAYVDAVIANAKGLLGKDHYALVFDCGLNAIVDDIRDDLAGFGVTMDHYFSERSLTENGTVDQALSRLTEHDNTFEKDGALWFKASAYGDDKDRVVVRANGQRTYIASDIAYHLDKRLRGFDQLLDILGSDHHGYVARVRAGLTAMGQPADSLEVQLMQFVSLYRNGEKVAMTTRGGQFVTLRELREEVGNDAARFFYVMRSNDQHLDFDLDLAKSHREENPVFYVQYAHARICQMLDKLPEQSLVHDEARGRANVDQLTQTKELALIKTLARFPDALAMAARDRAPQTIVHFLRDLASDLHSFYNDKNCRVIIDDDALRDARVALIRATQQVLRNGLSLLGVSAPSRM